MNRSAIVSCLDSMSVQSESPTPIPEAHAGTDGGPAHKPKRSMSRTQKILFFATGLADRADAVSVLVEHLVRAASFGPADDRISARRQEAAAHSARAGAAGRSHVAPRRGGEAVVSRPGAAGDDPVEEVRNTDAWVMGQDTSGAGFHEALLKMLQDSSPMVRGNAALSLVRFGDATGRPQIVALLQPAQVRVPTTGRIGPDTSQDSWSDKPRRQRSRSAAAGIAHSRRGSRGKAQRSRIYRRTGVVELRSPIPGRIRSVVQQGRNVHPGDRIAVVDPGTEQVWEALRALYLVGQLDDLRGDSSVRARRAGNLQRRAPTGGRNREGDSRTRRSECHPVAPRQFAQLLNDRNSKRS